MKPGTSERAYETAGRPFGDLTATRLRIVATRLGLTARPRSGARVANHVTRHLVVSDALLRHDEDVDGEPMMTRRSIVAVLKQSPVALANTHAHHSMTCRGLVVGCLAALPLVAACGPGKPAGASPPAGSVPTKSGVAPYSPPSSPNLGVCADVSVRAEYPGGASNFVAGAPAQIDLKTGQSFVLTAAGSCGVQYVPDNKVVAYAADESNPPAFLGGAPNLPDTAVPTSADASGLAPDPVRFTAISAGRSTLAVQVDDHINPSNFSVAIRIDVEVATP